MTHTMMACLYVGVKLTATWPRQKVPEAQQKRTRSAAQALSEAMYASESTAPPQRLCVFSMHTSAVRAQCMSSGLCTPYVLITSIYTSTSCFFYSTGAHRSLFWKIGMVLNYFAIFNNNCSRSSPSTTCDITSLPHACHTPCDREALGLR